MEVVREQHAALFQGKVALESSSGNPRRGVAAFVSDCYAECQALGTPSQTSSSVASAPNSIACALGPPSVGVFRRKSKLPSTHFSSSNGRSHTSTVCNHESLTSPLTALKSHAKHGAPDCDLPDHRPDPAMAIEFSDDDDEMMEAEAFAAFDAALCAAEVGVRMQCRTGAPLASAGRKRCHSLEEARLRHRLYSDQKNSLLNAERRFAAPRRDCSARRANAGHRTTAWRAFGLGAAKRSQPCHCWCCVHCRSRQER